MEEVSVKPTPASSSVKLGASVAWSTQGAPLLRREEIHYTEADLLGIAREHAREGEGEGEGHSNGVCASSQDAAALAPCMPACAVA